MVVFFIINIIMTILKNYNSWIIHSWYWFACCFFFKRGHWNLSKIKSIILFYTKIHPNCQKNKDSSKSLSSIWSAEKRLLFLFRKLMYASLEQMNDDFSTIIYYNVRLALLYLFVHPLLPKVLSIVMKQSQLWQLL